ncbi:MAG TPA: aminodeoxychorismate/anthranilate synthase component II [Flavobacterium lutivivi]|nr:aminodeoxychorismate/anthranilate synthase component II [Flavobacterium lutivivi]
MKIAVIDNYDSFTFNLVHYLEKHNALVTVFRNDELEIDELQDYDKILLSPGPGLPNEAGVLLKIIETYHKTKPILGICLGHQAIAEFFGAKLENQKSVTHGEADEIFKTDENEDLFKNISNPITVGRYHSWIVSNDNFPDELEITSVNNDNQIMSLRHKNYDIKGIQFHPESILTPNGETIIKNWIL